MMIATALVFLVVIKMSHNSDIPYVLFPRFLRTDKDSTMLLNQSADPCGDFYQYACGYWMENAVQPDHQALWSPWQDVRQRVFERLNAVLRSRRLKQEHLAKAKGMFQSCLHSGGVEAASLDNLRSLVGDLKGWPLAGQSFDAGGYSWAANVARVTRALGVYPLLKMQVFVDFQNTSQYILYIKPGTLNLPQTILANPQKYKQYIKAYFVWIKETVQYLYSNKTLPSIETDVANLIHFEIELAKLHLLKNKSERLSLSKLSKQFSIKWKEVFAELFHSVPVVLQPKDDVILWSRKYMTKLLALLSKTKPDTIANYIIWTAVKNLSRDITAYMRKLNFMMDNIILGVKQDLSREQECVDSVVTYMGSTLASTYSQAFLSRRAISYVKGMVENVKLEFARLIQKNPWLSKGTKRLAVEKIQSLKYVVAYPDWMNNQTLLRDQFHEVKISDNHLMNVVQLRSLRVKSNLMKLKQLVNVMWPASVFDVNAYYNVLQNSIFLPMGMLESPFFEVSRPSPSNYGALGSLIGHELSHALDVLGRHADKDGNIKNWWTQEDSSKYEQMLVCYREQYNSQNVSGADTLGENIADNVGLQISYRAFKNLRRKTAISPALEDQLFFVSFTQMWCEISSGNELLNDEEYAPAKIRVLGTLQNNKEFSNAFLCKRQQSCRLW